MILILLDVLLIGNRITLFQAIFQLESHLCNSVIKHDDFFFKTLFFLPEVGNLFPQGIDVCSQALDLELLRQYFVILTLIFIMYPQDLGFQADYVAIQPLNGRLRLLDLLFLIHHKLDFFLDGLLHDIRVRILPAPVPADVMLIIYAALALQRVTPGPSRNILGLSTLPLL